MRERAGGVTDKKRLTRRENIGKRSHGFSLICLRPIAAINVPLHHHNHHKTTRAKALLLLFA